MRQIENRFKLLPDTVQRVPVGMALAGLQLRCRMQRKIAGKSAVFTRE
jgi:hypothetical protein